MTIELFGRVLLHFLWQGVVIALVYGAGRLLLRRSAPNARYLLACAGLLAMVAAPAATWVLLRSQVSATVAASGAGAVHSVATVPGAPLVTQAVEFHQKDSSLLPWVVAVWACGVVALSLRLIGGWLFTLRLRTRSAAPAPMEWLQTLDTLRVRVGVSCRVSLLVSSLVDAPAVVGWMRPAILLPIGAFTGLPAEHIEALLLHELAHIRRADYLVNLMQSAAEALLFYHPAVWWVSGHIRAEREHCCDDAAVAATGDVLAYTQALADLESFRPARLQMAVAANSSALVPRIARLLGRPLPSARSFSGPEVLTGAILLAATALGLFAQSPGRPKFETASIKPAPDQGFMMIRPQPGGRLTANAPVQMLIQTAYSLQAFQIVGAPSWVASERYQIEAKGEGSATQAQFALMLQSLLEDRFQLKAHRDTRELPVYALVLAKSGPKLPPPGDGECRALTPDTPPPSQGSPLAALPPCGFVRTTMGTGGMLMQGSKITMTELTRTLAMALGRPVIDKTGYTASFDLKLEFSRDLVTAGLPGPPMPAGEPGAAAAAENGPPSILVAIQEQLGLKLDSAKGPVDVLVIDHVQRPSAN